MNPRLVLAVLLPFVACAVQWLLWDAWIKPYVWFLFFPAAFFSAWLGGLRGGVAGTVIGALLVWYVYIPPQFSFALLSGSAGASVALFVAMGSLFAWFFERLRQAMQRTDEALAAAETANAKVTRLYQKTLELDELKSQFFANLSHELRTPLTLIMSPLARRLAEAGGNEAARREDEMMLRNARLLYRHVSDLLDVAKLESGSMGVDYARLDLAELVRALASHFDSLARERGIDYRVDAPDAVAAEADGEKVQRILLNLLANAFKFTPDGGRIGVRLSADAGEAVIEVEDNGPGVPADLREAVFERFRQVEGGARRSHGGTGLGLAIVRQFAELHGGSAGLTEAPGGGARFTVRLPRHAPDGTRVLDTPGRLEPVLERQAQDELGLAVAPAAGAAGEGEAGAALVLVVEDNADMNAYIADSLRPFYRVARAGNGREGLELARTLRPDLILSDVMMPEMSGDQMVAELRRLPELADVPIVMLSARTDDDLRVRLLREGVQDYLNKPFTVAELLARVGGLVAVRRRTLAELGRSAARLRRLAGVVERIAAVRDLAGLMDIVRPAVRELTGADGATLVLREDGYCHYADEDAIGPLWKGQRFPLESCISGWAMLHAEAVVIEDIYADPRIPHAAYRPTFVKSLVMVPVGREQPVAAIGSYWASRHQASAEEVELQQALADAMSVGLANLELYRGMTEARETAERAAAEVRRLNADLERRVLERTAELSVANHELDSFAYAVSHDLRAPLRAMSGFAQALQEDYGGSLTGEAGIWLDQIGIASRRMGDLIDGILALSRSTRGELRCDAIDLSGLAQRLLDDLVRSEPGRQVACRVAPGLAATGDARMIEAVLGNLLGNAWKYTGKTAAPEIRVEAGEAGGRPGVCIVDNGAGFDMAHANRLFQPFQRLHRQEEFPGIGIGLATVQRIVHRHGGVIEARGEPGQGAVFCFTLPDGHADPATQEVD